jgi:hypothetical protein
LAIINHTIFEFKSGLLISFISSLDFSQSFFVNFSSIFSLFSPVFQSIRLAFEVYTVIFNIFWSLKHSISHSGIHLSSSFKIALAFISSAKEFLYVFLFSYQIDFHDFIYGILNITGFTLRHISNNVLTNKYNLILIQY